MRGRSSIRSGDELYGVPVTTKEQGVTGPALETCSKESKSRREPSLSALRSIEMIYCRWL